MKTTVYWNVNHDTAAIQFHGGYAPQEPPSRPINAVLEEMYSLNREGKLLQLYLYEVWDERVKNCGLLFAESIEASDEEIRAIWQDIIDANEAAPQTGRYEPKEFDA